MIIPILDGIPRGGSGDTPVLGAFKSLFGPLKLAPVTYVSPTGALHPEFYDNMKRKKLFNPQWEKRQVQDGMVQLPKWMWTRIDDLRKKISNMPKSALFVPTGPVSLILCANLVGHDVKVGGEYQTLNHCGYTIPTYSPNRLLVTPEVAFEMRKHVARIGRRLSEQSEFIPKEVILEEPEYDQHVWEESIEHIIQRAKKNGLPVICDIETYPDQKVITCIGFKCGHTSIVLPLVRQTLAGYVSVSIPEYAKVAELCRKILDQKSITVVFHNGHYDLGYFFRNMGIWPKCSIEDTMVMIHILNPSAPKSLAAGVCFYADHYSNWKNSADSWTKTKDGLKRLVTYNKKDLNETWKLYKAALAELHKTKLIEVYRHRMRSYLDTFKIAIRGMAVDPLVRTSHTEHMESEQKRMIEWCNKVFPSVAITSPQQLAKLFYTSLNLPKRFHPKKGNLTTDDDALLDISEKTPWMKPVISRIRYARTMGTLLGHVRSELSPFSNRFQYSYNMCGTDTYRLSSNSNQFNEGTNAQNLTKGNSKGPWYDRAPNLRTMLVPDPGYVLFDGDLSRADVYVVAWEANEPDLKQMLKLGLDTHCSLSVEVWDIKGIPIEELREDHPNYLDHRAKIGEAQRHKMKAGGHATNYYVQPRTLAKTLGITVKEAEDFQNRYFGRFPGIKRTHINVENQLRKFGRIKNKFGYEYEWLGKIDHHAIAAALAWTPQSTVGIVTQEILTRFCAVPNLQVLMQNHDAILFQLLKDLTYPNLKELGKVIVPYPDPLIIPFDIQQKEKSWGGKSVLPGSPDFWNLS